MSSEQIRAPSKDVLLLVCKEGMARHVIQLLMHISTGTYTIVGYFQTGFINNCLMLEYLYSASNKARTDHYGSAPQ